MFESNRFESDYYQEQRDAITFLVIFIVVVSILYFLVVFFSEVWTTLCAEKQAARKRAALRKKGGDDDSSSNLSLAKRVSVAVLGGTPAASRSLEMHAVGTFNPAHSARGLVIADSNPLFASGGAGGSSAPQAAVPDADSVEHLLRDNDALRKELRQVKAALTQAKLAGATNPAGRRGKAGRKREFQPHRSAGADGASSSAT